MWEISLSQQVETVLLSVVTGAFFGFLYDTFKLFRKVFSLKTLGVFICDIAFFTVIAPIEFCFFVSRSNGEIRGFILVTELIGFIICRVTASKLYLKIMLFLFSKTRTVIRLINLKVCKILSPVTNLVEKFTKKLKDSQKNWNFFRKKG